MTEPPHVPVYVANGPTWDAGAVFNDRTFPRDIYKYNDMRSCHLRVAMLEVQARTVSNEINATREQFIAWLKANQEAVGTPIIQAGPSIPPWIAYADHASYTSALYNFLATIKSFLDIYAQLVGQSLIGPKYQRKCERREVDGTEGVPGGQLITQLRRSGNHAAQELATVVLRHSKHWILQAVKYRDDASHYKDFPDSCRLRVRLLAANPYFDEGAIVLPTMPDGTETVAWVRATTSRLKRFVFDTATLLPGVSLDPTAEKRFLPDY